jgi:hypothetical protein
MKVDYIINQNVKHRNMKKTKKKTLAKSATENFYGKWQHPETLENEVFLINVSDDDDWSNIPDFLVSVRRGEVAYTTGGKAVVEGMKPLFGLQRYDHRRTQTQ